MDSETPVVAVAVEPESTVIRAPFVRYDLKSSAIAPPLPVPTDLQQRNVPLESWNEFWIKLRPMVRSVEFYDSVFNTILIILTIATLLLVLTFIVTEVEGELYNFFYLAFLMILLFSIFASISGNKRTSQLEQLRLVCRDEQDRIFGSHGFALECEFEWGVIIDGTTHGTNTYGFRLYFLPAGLLEAGPTNTLALSTNDATATTDFQHGYLRILLFNSGSCGCSWTPFSMSYLALFQTLPVGFESLEAWPDFWSEMTALSKDCLLSFRLQFVAQWAYVIIIFTMILLADTSTNGTVHSFVLILFLTSIISFFIVSCRFTTLMNARSFLVQQSARRFADQGVYMEYRTVYKFHKYLGMYGVHYLYLFPMDNDSSMVSVQEATSAPDTTIV